MGGLQEDDPVRWFALLLLVGGVVLPRAAWAERRRALIVANDLGLEDEVPLRHTGSDAGRMAAVLRELGGFAPEDIQVLRGGDAGSVLAALDRAALNADPSSLFYFYFSGHADAGALHLSGTVLPVETLLARLGKIPAGLRIGVLDACQSGSATRAKGVSSGPAFEVRVEPRSSEGQVLISSSAADEQSFESDRSGGAVFTLHWTAGLRGAADRNQDGRVSLSEAYGYAYAQTVRATLLSQGGPQHPSFRWELSGRRDPVLTRLKGAAGLTVVAESEGELLVFDGEELELIAELPLRPSNTTRLSLPPGRYVLRKRGPSSLRTARISLDQGDDRVLPEHRMTSVPLVKLAQKGALGERWVTAAVGQYATAMSVSGLPQLQLGVEWDGARWLWSGAVLGSTGTQLVEGLGVRQSFVGPLLSLLYTARAGPVTGRVGPAIGALVLHQEVPGDPDRFAMGALMGVRLRGELSLRSDLGVFVAGDLLGLLVRTEDRPAGSGLGGAGATVLPWASYHAGVRLNW